MNNYWANQKGRGPNSRSNGGSERNNQALNSHSSPEGHSITPQSIPQRAPNNWSNRGSEPNNQALNSHSSLGGHSRAPQGMPQRAPNNRSTRGSDWNNQAFSSHPSPWGNSRTPQDMPQRASNNRSSHGGQGNNQVVNSHTSPPISSRTNPQRPQIHHRFTQGRYQDPNIGGARITQPSRVPFATSAINNATALIVAYRYGRPLPIDFPTGNITNLNYPATQGNLFNHGGIGNSFNGGVDYTPNGLSNYSRPSFTTNGFSYFSRPNFATSAFTNSLRPDFHNNQRNIFSYGESYNNSPMINDFINNPRTRINMNNFYNQRSLLSFEENFNNSSLFNNDNFMINPSTSVNMNNNFPIFESNPIVPSPTPPAEINDLEPVRTPSTNAVDLARERALKRPLIDVDQETEDSKRPRMTNDFCEGQQSELKELLLFKDSDDGEKNAMSSASGTATYDDGNQNDEENLDLSLHL